MSYNELLKMLGECRVQNKVFSVHDFTTKKVYPVDINNVISFFRLYSDCLYCKEKNQWNISPIYMLGEVTAEIIPVITEFTLKFEQDTEVEKETLIDKKLMHRLIDCHHQVFNEIVHVSPNCTEYTCIATISRPFPSGQGLVSQKIKLIFPYCRMSKINLGTIFRTRLLTKIRKTNLNRYFSKCAPIGSWEQHLQPVKEFYSLYGSTDNPKEAPTVYEAVYGEFIDSECKDIPLEEAFDLRQWQFIKTGQCVYEEIDTLVEEEGAEQKGNYEASYKLLPLFCSINFASHISRIKEKNLGGAETSSSADPSESMAADENDPDPTQLEIAIEMIDILGMQRFEEENYFLEIGKALYNASGGTEDGLKIWFRSGDERGCDYDMDFCRNHYDEFDNEYITVKTLAWYARKDNLARYQQWHDNWCLSKLSKCYREQDDIIVAEAFYRVFWLDYSFHNKLWYKFDKSRLKKTKDEVYLRLDITQKFIPKFISLRSQICEEQLNIKAHAGRSTRLEKESKDLEAHLSAITKLIKKLHSDRFRNTLVRCVRDYFHIEDLHKMLDINPNLLGVKNGVIELLEDRAIFRPGKPEDYITKKAGVSYRPEYTMSHPDIKKIILYFRQVFPNEEVNHHMKKDVASMLYGHNPEKLFRMWIGDTNGSKTIFQRILKYMFGAGEYYADLPPEFFSASQKGSSGPSPELAQLKGSRVAFSDEPDDDMDFKGARIKKMTGNGSFFARGCGEDGGSIDATFKMFMVLNIVPNISGMDYATLKRLSMILFEGQWLKPNEAKAINLPDDIEEQIKLKKYIMDDRIENDIPRLASALMWLAVKYYADYRREGIENPPYVTKWMEEYWKRHDPYNAYIIERLENVKVRVECEECNDFDDNQKCDCCKGEKYIEKPDTKKYITSTDIFPDFRRWMKDTYPNLKAINKTKMTEILSSKDKLGKQRERRWYGYKLKEYEVNILGE